MGSAVDPVRDISISKDYSYNSDKSIKINSIKQNGSWIRFRIQATSDMIGKNVTVKARLLLLEGEISSHLLLNSSVKSQIKIYANPNEFIEVALSTTLLNDTTTIDFNFAMQNAALIYLDNLTAIIQ